ncbi:uncharacterized protein LOC110026106 [Phalaenopsis equestris]|uniref:uncharacterized protein LOC110024937 n=1 Tax=Phalaenopsis equestris TaxID=78828 RepID=UPI0009E3EC96|nr:uncharacterized protein LOC110024937 [Phalaenopsis equestris]XP_020582562.1 uncharacterized protein LOC110026106 [Phalaenopsis equestris]
MASSSNVLLLLLMTAGLILTSLPSTTPANHLVIRQYMPPGFSLNYQNQYIFEMRNDCNAAFREVNSPDPIWQTYINFDGPKERCHLKIRINCNIVILSEYGGIVLWESQTQLTSDGATHCFIEITENATLYDGAARNKLWVNGNKV